MVTQSYLNHDNQYARVGWGAKMLLMCADTPVLPLLSRLILLLFPFQLVINLLPYIQSSMNPIIYGFMSKNFRRSLQTSCQERCYNECCAKRSRHFEMDLETKSMSYNGTYVTKFSHTASTRLGGTTSMADV